MPKRYRVSKIKTHEEGRKIIIFTSLFVALGVVGLYFILPLYIYLVLLILFIALECIVVRFFRIPHRHFVVSDEEVFSGADGRICAIEEVYEGEYFKDKRLLISVFMTINNVHINWYSIKGIVKYFAYHEGKYLIASHPKSSTDNERSTVVIERKDGVELMQRQIAGYVARRIICYSNEGDTVNQCDELGFIKFGSRIDHYLPLDAKINVKIDDKVVGGITSLATIKERC